MKKCLMLTAAFMILAGCDNGNNDGVENKALDRSKETSLPKVQTSTNDWTVYLPGGAGIKFSNKPLGRVIENENIRVQQTMVNLDTPAVEDAESIVAKILADAGYTRKISSESETTLRVVYRKASEAGVDTIYRLQPAKEAEGKASVHITMAWRIK